MPCLQTLPEQTHGGENHPRLGMTTFDLRAEFMITPSRVGAICWRRGPSSSVLVQTLLLSRETYSPAISTISFCYCSCIQNILAEDKRLTELAAPDVYECSSLCSLLGQTYVVELKVLRARIWGRSCFSLCTLSLNIRNWVSYLGRENYVDI